MPRAIEPTDKLLDLIYDAATEHELWRSVLIEIADQTDGRGGILIGQSLAASKVLFDFNGRLDEDCNRAYQEHHFVNPWALGMIRQPVGRIVLSDELVPLSDLKSTLFYEEVLRPQDVAHNAMAALADKEDFVVAFNICRSSRKGLFGNDDRRFIESAMPHLLRSLQLSMVDLNATYLDYGDFKETGAGAANLSVRGDSDWVFVASPALEIGGEWRGANGTLARPYARIGGTFLSDSDFALTSSFTGAPTGVTPFTVSSKFDDNYLDVGAGIDILNFSGIDLKLNYDGRFAEDSEMHSAGIKVGMKY